jgi:hypothetical protein
MCGEASREHPGIRIPDPSLEFSTIAINQAQRQMELMTAMSLQNDASTVNSIKAAQKACHDGVQSLPGG